jgi:hypothetical protein
MKAPLATVASPVSRTATTMSGVLCVIFQTLSALMLCDSESARFHWNQFPSVFVTGVAVAVAVVLTM